ncbi:hypothetical protein A2807_02550 [Candidatus Berkelbacteria bacterium RIFCSPHIGHO2_01_FULL_50_36]|nr:MAG: hypothetical protein A2807_02550 [Candidatus Berkelbacteria bacterium RIFCSPHIGHO2_01_FULL_50_36]OGD62679.1 MAG: hypothetical protein A3F39_00565 [Candidatus Berkelbacteria bacterium RIFCSPHIGHO2_12_FULL_50_11]
MPKVKTNKSAAKRLVGSTRTGKLVLRKTAVRHRAKYRSKRAGRQAQHNQVIAPGMAKKIRQLI